MKPTAKALGAKCDECPMLASKFVPTEWSKRNQPPAVAIVGEAPGRREVQLGRPFIGVSGKLLNQACAQSNIPRSELAILNAISCGPIPSAAETIKNKAAACCRPRLLNELRALRPRATLAVGGLALAALARDKDKVTAVRGAALPMAMDVQAPEDHLFISTLHPAHILRGGNGEKKKDRESRSVDMLYFFFLYDLAKAWRAAKGDLKPWRDELDLFVGYDAALPDALTRVYHEAREIGEVAIDVETDGVDQLNCGLTAIAFATRLGGVSATWDALRAPPAIAVVMAILADPTTRKIFQNKIFDTCVLPRHGLPVLGPADDTLLMHHAAFPGLPHTLDQMASQFFLAPPWKVKFRQSGADVEDLTLYNGRDAFATALLVPPLRDMLKARQTERIYEADRQQFAIATRMCQVGYYVDLKERARHSKMQHERINHMRHALAETFASVEPQWRQAWARRAAVKTRKNDPVDYLARIDKRLAEIDKRKRKSYDVGPFKPKSTIDVAALFDTLGIPITTRTKKGNISIDKDALEAASGSHPILRKLHHIREAQQLLSIYIDGLPIDHDGRVHPAWSPKITGRWGAGRAQNWSKYIQGWPPERDEQGNFRVKANGDYVTPYENPRSIVAAPPGRVLVDADFEQLELRIVGYLARDPFLLDVFLNRKDPHAMFARECFPDHFPALERDWQSLAGGLPQPLKIKSADLDAVDLPAKVIERLKWIQKRWNRLRDLTKRAEYGGIYLGGEDALYEALHKDFAELTLLGLQGMLRVMRAKLVGVERWRNEQLNNARIHREVREPILGRVRLFPLGHFDPSIVVNFPIQAAAASLLALSLFRFVRATNPSLLQVSDLHAFGLLDPGCDWPLPLYGSADIVLNGHDSLLIECDERDGKQIRELLQASMTHRLPLEDGSFMEFPAEAKIKKNWGEG